jgi:DNA uptake protein ComE-like DNA-binding protein
MVINCWPQADHDYSARHPPSTVPAESRLDVNHATVDELLKLPGMKRTWALRILRFRPYRTKLDLLDEGVLPSEIYARIRDLIIAHRDNNESAR